MQATAIRSTRPNIVMDGFLGGKLTLTGKLQKHRPPIQPAIILLLLLGPVCPLESAGIYKWMDEKGNVHYGDQPPGAHAEQVHIPAEPRDIEVEHRLGRQQRLLDVLAEEREQHKQELVEQKDVRLARQANCQTATRNLDAIQNSSYLYEQTADPYNPKILTHEERNAAVAEANQEVAEWCNGGR